MFSGPAWAARRGSPSRVISPRGWVLAPRGGPVARLPRERSVHDCRAATGLGVAPRLSTLDPDGWVRRRRRRLDSLGYGLGGLRSRHALSQRASGAQSARLAGGGGA